MNYQKLNNILGWLVFAIAAFTYISTLEPTASFWDCGEYIATSYRLEVGHPPGAPTFLLIGRLFSMFVAPDQVAYMVNLISGLTSAFTILFLFWTITALAKKVLGYNKDTDEFSPGDLVAITTPEGQQLQVQIPPGVTVGTAFLVNAEDTAQMNPAFVAS